VPPEKRLYCVILTEIRRLTARFPYDNSSCRRDKRFTILGVHSCVADQRVAECYDLVGIRQVCNDFLCTCHGRIEHQFTFCSAIASESVSFINGTVFKYQLSFLCKHYFSSLYATFPSTIVM